MLTKNQIYEAVVTDYTSEGQGVAHIEGCAVFIPNAIAGERERGTFDMLRLSGTRTSAIILGKYAFVVLITMVILVMDVLALAFGLWQFTPELFDIAAVQGAKNPVWFMSVLGCMFSMAILTSALYLTLSASFEKSKQAASYSSMVQLVLSLLTYASNVVGAGLLAYVPIGNVWVVLGKALKGETTITYVACSMAIAVVISAAALWYASLVFCQHIIPWLMSFGQSSPALAPQCSRIK